jgi:transcriptional regulator with XRE-family HTH domain
VSQQRKNDLGDFLRTRRAALTPEATGVPTYGKDRRVPGLRREEVALLAGVSVKSYTRLEQGESHQVSDQVLEAIAGALRLNETDRRHLARLAWPTPLIRRTQPETVRDSLLALAEATTDRVAFIVGRHLDLLAGNRLGYALLGLPHGQPVNMALQTFLDPAFRDLYVDWEVEARNYAAYLRVATVTDPDDPRLAELVGELSIKSPDFVRMWAAHPVGEWAHGIHEYNHPQVGRLTLVGEGFDVADEPCQHFTFQSPAPGSDAAERLQLLGSLAAE